MDSSVAAGAMPALLRSVPVAASNVFDQHALGDFDGDSGKTLSELSLTIETRAALVSSAAAASDSNVAIDNARENSRSAPYGSRCTSYQLLMGIGFPNLRFEWQVSVCARYPAIILWYRIIDEVEGQAIF